MGNGNLQSVQKESNRHRGKMLENLAASTNKIITLKITLQYAKKKKDFREPDNVSFHYSWLSFYT